MRFFPLLARVSLAMLFVAEGASAQRIDSLLMRGLKWRHIGPDGNRVIAVAGVPGNAAVAYAGSASGGLFKTEDGGHVWKAVFDDQPVQTIGSIALAPSNANVVYVGTGETFLRSNVAMGLGAWRSDDAGKTWRHVGLDATGRIGRMVVDPRNADVAWSCALGHTYAPQQDRGVYRTRDGGKTWQRVLFVDPETGCSDLAIDPTNPDVLFAGMWQVSVRTWMLNSGGPGSGIFVSRDGGSTWQRIRGHGLSAGPVGKVAVAVARSDPRRVYALVEESDPVLYRSDDGGQQWREVSRNHDMAERAPYYVRFGIDPTNADHLWFVSVRLSESLDGGRTLKRINQGGDNHDVWIDPTNAQRVLVGNDGGIMLTLNGGKTWARPPLPDAQMYHAFTDDRIPYNVFGNRQDGYSYMGPSDSRQRGGIPLGAWHAVGGCESGFAIADPAENDIVWSGCYDGGLQRTDVRTGHTRDVRVWPDAAYGWPPADVKLRWNWTFPLAISPHDHATVYAGSQLVHRTRDGGQSWQAISPDLTTNDKSHQQSSGGLTPDNLMVNDGSTLFALAESPIERGLLWAGSNDGQVWLTRDSHADAPRWENVTRSLPGLPPWGTVSNIEPSRFAPGRAYVAIDFHQVGDFDPWIYTTSDYGRSWRRIDAGIPRSPTSFVHVVREDAAKPGLLFAGTDNAVYVSPDDGASWAPLQGNLPHAPVNWLTVQPRFGDLVAATYGRGFWILDDISPLRQLGTGAADTLAFFEPRPAWRFQPVGNTYSGDDGEAAGDNPPYGAGFGVWLPPGQPLGKATVTILGAAGDTVRVLTPTLKTGLNRVEWDLRYTSPRRARLRVPPPGRPWVPMDSTGTRPLVTWDLDLSGGELGPLAPPGTYTATVTYAGRAITRQVKVQKDPNTAGSEADVRAQVATSLELRRDMNDIVAMIERLERIRQQLVAVRDSVARRPPAAGAGELLKADSAAERAAIAVESRLFDVNLTGAREDAFRAPMRLYGKLAALAHQLGAASADFPPTSQQLEVKRVLEAEIASAREALEAFAAGELAALNALARTSGLREVTGTD